MLHITSLAHTQFGPNSILVPHSLWPQAYFSLRYSSAQVILRPDAYFGPDILRPKTTSVQYTSARESYFQKCHFALSIGLGVPQSEIKAMIINNTRSGTKLTFVISLTFIHQCFQSRPIF